MTKMTSTRQSGFTLLELLLVIGVAALLLIGGIATYRLVSDGNKTTDTSRLLLTIRQEAQTMAQQQNGLYTGITFDSGSSSATSPLVVGGVLRDRQRSPFNGVIAITVVNSDQNISVSFNNLPPSACEKLATAVNNPSEVVSVSINGGAVTVPVTAAAAASGCNIALNTIVWVFP